MTATLLIVSGLPASGKSSVAARLSAMLGWPVLERDRLAEVCFTGASALTPAEAGSLSWELLFTLIATMAAAPTSVIVDANFSRTRHGLRLMNSVGVADVRLVEVQCEASPGTLAQRYESRAATRAGHHDDADRVEEWRQKFADESARTDALVFPGDAIRIDTDHLTLDDAAAAVLSALR